MPTPQYSASRPGSRGPPHDEWAEVHGRDQSQPCVGRGESVGRTRRTVPVPERREDAPTRGPDTARPRALRRTRSLPANCPGWLRTLHLRQPRPRDRKSTRLNSSHITISYAVFCLKKKKKKKKQ